MAVQQCDGEVVQ